eukprot:TRINITY_DN35493_c0_g1_i1.p1 TRINITY_DN35493_c0_g1~~TRINITY_DN35493_c0_g1_i1.p1  ORF type:complete len:700 (+),score=250.20 TRINITY_DN35493_c0_g1_i1:52-2151(+)
MGSCGGKPSADHGLPLSTARPEPVLPDAAAAAAAAGSAPGAAPAAPLGPPPPSAPVVPAAAPPRATLREALRGIVLSELPPAAESAPLGAVLALDPPALDFIECVATVTDLTAAGLPVAELLSDKKRQPMPRMPCVYLLGQPESAALVAREWAVQPPVPPSGEMFAETGEDGQVRVYRRVPPQSGPPYSYAEVVTLGALPSASLAALGDVPVPRGVRELPGGFFLADHGVYSIFPLGDARGGLSGSLSAALRQADVEATLERACKGVASVLRVLGDKPRCRWQKKSATAERLSQMLSGADATGAGAELLIVDRSFDPIAPLVYSQHYEAMLTDALRFGPAGGPAAVLRGFGKLEASHEVTSRDGEQRRMAHVLDADDQTWQRYRDMHIDHLVPVLKRDSQEALRTQQAAERSGAGVPSIAELRSRIQAIAPDAKRKYGLASLHADAVSTLAAVLGKEGTDESLGDGKLADAILLQQDVLTRVVGVNSLGEGGHALGDASVWARLERLAGSAGCPTEAVMRTVLLHHAMTGGLPQADRMRARKLLAPCGVTAKELDAALAGLTFLSGTAVPTSWVAPPEELQEDGTPKWLLCRAAPRLRQAAQELMRGTLDPSQFGGTSAARAAAGAAMASGRRRSEPRRTRLHIFVIGGVCTAELCALRALAAAESVTLTIGCTGLLQPEAFVEQLKAVAEQRLPDFAG